MQRLRELGWIDGRNVAMEYRWGEAREERFAEFAARGVYRLPTPQMKAALASL